MKELEDAEHRTRSPGSSFPQAAQKSGSSEPDVPWTVPSASPPAGPNPSSSASLLSVGTCCSDAICTWLPSCSSAMASRPWSSLVEKGAFTHRPDLEASGLKRLSRIASSTTLSLASGPAMASLAYVIMLLSSRSTCAPRSFLCCGARSALAAQLCGFRRVGAELLRGSFGDAHLS